MMGNDQNRTRCLPRIWTDEPGSHGRGYGEQLDLDHVASDFELTNCDLDSRFVLLPDDDHEARSTADQGNGLYSNSSFERWIYSSYFLQQPVEIEDSVVEVPVPGLEPDQRADHEDVHAIPVGLNLSRPPFNCTTRLRTKNEPWKDHWRDTISRIRSSSEGEPLCIPSAGSEMVEEEGFLVTGAVGLFCTNVGKAPGREELVVYNVKTEKFRALPPLVHRRHPVLMHLSVDERGEYKVLVSGSACRIANLDPDLSLKTDVYDSVTGAWECCTDLPCPLSEYQTGAFHKDSEGHGFLCCVADFDNHTKEVLMFDYQKKQWVPVSVLRHIPRLSGDFDEVSHVTSTQVVGCGGSIFVFSEQENGRDKYFCIDEFRPDCDTSSIRSRYRMWKQIWQRKRTDSGSRRLQVFPEFMCVPLSATVIETGEIVVVFSEQESGKNVFICIHILDDQNPLEGPEILRRKRARPRDKNWIVEETFALLKSKEEGLEVVVGKDWEYISKRLEEDYGFSRSAQSCENRWGTLLKRHTDIRKDIQSKNLCPDTSGWVNYWNQHKSLQVECYEMMDRIMGIKPRKKSGASKKQNQPAVVDAANAGTLSRNPQLLDPSADLSSNLQDATTGFPSAAQTFDAEDEGRDDEQHENDDGERPGSLVSEVSGLCAVLQGRQQWTNEQYFKIQVEAVDLYRKKLELEILRETNKLKARECAERPRHRRPRKYRKKTLRGGGVLSYDSDFE